MSAKRLVVATLVAVAALVAVPALAQEPTIDQVYKAAESGNFGQAQRMMDEVLRAHPNSAKAHYVEAELLAKQGRMAAAAGELNTAERLDPGLSFAKPQSVQELKQRLASRPGPGLSSAPMAAPAASSGISWTAVILGLGVVAVVFLVVQAMRRRNATYIPAGGAPGFGGAPGPMQPYGTGAPMASGPFGGGGIGSGILGGLATGAAVGAGIVAGEALAHRLGGESHQGDAGYAPGPGTDVAQSLPNDMGGGDFGISDGSSWDDGGGLGGGGGGSDWT